MEWMKHLFCSLLSSKFGSFLSFFTFLSPHMESHTLSRWPSFRNFSQIRFSYHCISFLLRFLSSHVSLTMLADSCLSSFRTRCLHINLLKISFHHVNSMFKTISHSPWPRGQHSNDLTWLCTPGLHMTFPDLSPTVSSSQMGLILSHLHILT